MEDVMMMNEDMEALMDQNKDKEPHTPEEECCEHSEEKPKTLE